MDQEDQRDHNPPWWTSRGFYILLMEWLRGDERGGGVSFVKVRVRGWRDRHMAERWISLVKRGPEGWGEYPMLLVHIRFSS